MLQEVHKKVLEAHPTLVGIQAIDPQDRNTWVLEFPNGTSQATKDAARAVMLAVVAPTALDAEIKAFASGWINKTLKDDKTQRNMTALSVSLLRKESKGDQAVKATLDLLDAAQTWVQQVLALSRTLRQSQDVNYKNAAWPAPPAGLAALVDQL